jgi:tetratricopeptide (TPR) repeat protein
MTVSANRMTKQQLRHDSFVEGTARATAFLQENFMAVLVGIAVVAIVVLGSIWWSQSRERSSVQASQLMFKASNQYSAAQYGDALLVLDDLKSRYGGTSEGRDAFYLSGACHLALGESDPALADFDEYLDLKPKGLYAESAKLGGALAMESRGDLEPAAQRLDELRKSMDPEDGLFAQVCLAEARVREAQSDYAGAITALQSLASSEDYTQSLEAKSRIQALEALR